MPDSRTPELFRYRRMTRARRLLLVLGDQLDAGQPALGHMDREQDAVLMAEVSEEAVHAPSHRQRTTLFLSAMRHHAVHLIERGHRVRYVTLDEKGNTQSLSSELQRAVQALSPESVQVVQPGDHRVAAALRKAGAAARIDLKILPDTSFTCSLEEFDAWADDGRKSLVMEYFYRQRRRALGFLMQEDGKPVGGEWNFDKQNRQAFKQAPDVPQPYLPRPDELTRDVMKLVERTWPDAPGRMNQFRWPVTRSQARRALSSFVDQRLEKFGTYEDAMWTAEPTLYHSRLSSSLNLKLLSPRECVRAALEAFQEGRAAINDVEGFVRQLIGWREFIRGIYYHEGPEYRNRNGLDQHGSLPAFFWNGDTDMNCLSHCLNEVLDDAWGHHIPRLMVIGNFALTAGVHPGAVNDWFLGMYVDAVDWVTAPNVMGMSQHADHGIVGTKPYAASGKYIHRMSNYCKDCRYDVKKSTGEDACPFNTLYWDFLLRKRATFRKNRRMAIALSNVDRLAGDDCNQILARARKLRRSWGIGSISRSSGDHRGPEAAE